MKLPWGNWRSLQLCTAVILPQLPTQEGPVRADKEPRCSVCSGREAKTPCGVPPPTPASRDLMSRTAGAVPHPTPSPGEPCSHSVPSADVPWDGGQIQEHPYPPRWAVSPGRRAVSAVPSEASGACFSASPTTFSSPHEDPSCGEEGMASISECQLCPRL